MEKLAQSTNNKWLEYLPVLLGKQKAVQEGVQKKIRVRTLDDPRKYWEFTRQLRSTVLNVEVIVEYCGN